SGKSTDDVFKLLKFDKGENIYIFQDILLLSTWVSYINKIIKENPDKKDALFIALQARLQDRPLNQILNDAKVFPRMEIIAAKVQTTKIQNYYMGEEPPMEVFELLVLDDIGND
ncbi:Avirulence (Avh) protein, partial [Phytophthora megakarya]